MNYWKELASGKYVFDNAQSHYKVFRQDVSEDRKEHKLGYCKRRHRWRITDSKASDIFDDVDQFDDGFDRPRNYFYIEYESEGTFNILSYHMIHMSYGI